MTAELESPKRAPPFSIRLSPDERARLETEAEGIPLGSYIKAKALGDPPLRRVGLIEDRRAIAQALSLLGKTHYASNVNQLAHLAHLGALPLTPEVVAELETALRHIAEMRRLLVSALGLKADG